MKVYLIGVGMGNPEAMTVGALEAIKVCPVLVGAPRLLEPWTESHDCVPLIAGADIAEYIGKQRGEGPIGVLLSGDTGFYSGAKKLWALLGDHEVITLPGISSLSYFCARLHTDWQDVKIVSAHGRSHNAVGEIQRNARTFALTGGATKAQDICKELVRRGLGNVTVSVGRAGAPQLPRRADRHRHRRRTGGRGICRPVRAAGGEPRPGGAALERLRPARRRLPPG